MEAALPPLPEPLSNLPQEISFRRLLQACHTLVQHPTPPPGSQGEAALPLQPDVQAFKLKHYIETLQEQLEELERSYAIELGFKALSAYRQHVAALVPSMPRPVLPAYCLKPKPPAPLPLAAPTAAPPAGGKGPRVFTPGPPVSSAGPSEEHGHNSLSAALSEAARKKLQEQEALHDSLTDRLGELVGVVKGNALGAQVKVEERGRLVDAAEGQLEQNLDTAKAVLSKTKAQHKRGGSTFCLTLGILLLVALVFTAMIVYIKFTHLVGYRHRAATRQQTKPFGTGHQEL